MQSQGRRGRACQDCRRRKIKCSEQTPACQQCIISKIECSGPIEGPIIVEFNPQHERRQHRKRERKEKGTPRRASAGPASTAEQGRMPEAAVVESPSIHALSDSLVTLDTLALKFQACVSVPSQRRNSVAASLMDWVTSDQLPGLRVTIGAVSVAVAGIETENWSLLHESQKLYGTTLKTLRDNMSKVGEEKSAVIRTAPELPLSVEMMALSVVCVWYEATNCISPDGWIKHSFGAGRIALAKTPEDFTSGHAHAVFRTVRYVVANASLVTIQPTPLALYSWQTVPFSFRQKEPMDRLVDFMLAIPICLSLIDRLLAGGVAVPEGVQVADIKEKVMQIDRQLDSWWTGYQDGIIANGHGKVYRDIEDDWEDVDGMYHPAKREFHSDNVCESMAHYGVCRVFVAAMKYTFEDPSSPLAAACYAQAISNSALTLSAAMFAEARSTTRGAREYYSMAIPHILLLFMAPSKAQRRYAKSKLDRWAVPDGLKGAAVVDDSIIHTWRNLSTIWPAIPDNAHQARPASGQSSS